MRVRALFGWVLGLALVACETGVEPGTVPRAAGTTTSTPTASSLVTCTRSEGAGPLVAYTDERDLWLYDAKTDVQRRLTDDGETRYEHEPEFLTDECIVYASSEPTTIELLGLSGTRSRRTIVEEKGLIVSIDVSPDGSSILYLHIDFDVDGTYRLKQVGINGGDPVVLHTFSQNPGRGAGSEDEASVAWSPDGSAILVVNTHEDAPQDRPKAIYLFDRTGRTVRERWTGTHARWAPDGRTIYYRGYAGYNGQDWYALDVPTMKATKVGFRSGTNRLVVSPDGRRVAYDTSYFGEFPMAAEVSGEPPNAYVFDLVTGKETLLKRGALEPLWISAREVVVTNAREPGRSLNSWESSGTVTKISINGERAKTDMTSTLFDSAVYLGT